MLDALTSLMVLTKLAPDVVIAAFFRTTYRLGGASGSSGAIPIRHPGLPGGGSLTPMSPLPSISALVMPRSLRTFIASSMA